jgi:hypothetical protein
MSMLKMTNDDRSTQKSSSFIPTARTDYAVDPGRAALIYQRMFIRYT